MFDADSGPARAYLKHRNSYLRTHSLSRLKCQVLLPPDLVFSLLVFLGYLICKVFLLIYVDRIFGICNSAVCRVRTHIRLGAGHAAPFEAAVPCEVGLAWIFARSPRRGRASLSVVIAWHVFFHRSLCGVFGTLPRCRHSGCCFFQ